MDGQLQHYSFASGKCDFCVGKTHCDKCSREFEAEVSKMGCLDVHISTKDRTMDLRLNGVDEDNLLDRLEEMGVMADPL